MRGRHWWWVECLSYLRVVFSDVFLSVGGLVGTQLSGLCYLLDLIIRETDDYVFGFEVSVDDLAHPMHVV